MAGEVRETRPLRADARRNAEQLLAAARDVVVERGAGAPLDEIARRAGVGIATLYRRFPDRSALLRAVVLDALERTARAAAAALSEETDGFAALVRYMHAALDARVSAVIPLVLDILDPADDDLQSAREASAGLVQRVVDEAHADGSLPADVTFGDIGTLLVRLSRPLPGPVPPALDEELAHRHLDLLVEGLRPSPGRRAPGGPRLERADLRGLQEEARP
ncbi:TetR/AcrR family transcriptional regulator [Geodermatophilus aquaeductus]|uniref:Transcriptional regulator, TetR family n=1 Tax=Geodermatophilus aquaeductus TaxID=1564161 RepID=A0A521BEB0_9ACTN|nr:TetR/AcrR family transcriptional regulator [Geodermatophilus aquaeductus]SMO45399.1 transcriptional regulator, TetR family [Geodermatophilus aquaeductus]